ncbi:MAG: response regulator [Neomegalonema sp.]|nr:response regulator [Neomegalonema sp.]
MARLDTSREAANNATNGQAPLVLLVEDAITTRTFCRTALEEAGFQVAEAANGLEGLERFVEQQPAMIFCDINMPKMDGYQFVTAVRNGEDGRDVPIIMLSTEAEDADLLAAFRLGANFYCVKPPRAEALQTLAEFATGWRRPQ